MVLYKLSAYNVGILMRAFLNGSKASLDLMKAQAFARRAVKILEVIEEFQTHAGEREATGSRRRFVSWRAPSS